MQVLIQVLFVAINSLLALANYQKGEIGFLMLNMFVIGFCSALAVVAATDHRQKRAG